MEKNQAETGDKKLFGGEWVLAIFNRVVRASLAEKVTFDQRPSGGERVSHANTRKNIVEKGRPLYEGRC